MYNPNDNSNFRRKRFFFGPFFLLLMFGLSAIVMLLWNAILPDVMPGVGKLSYWQAAGILLLSRILFGGFRFGPPGGRGPFGPQQQWRKKWMGMSDEEKAKFSEEWRKRCEQRK